jgi:hypothetical protein
VNLFPTIAIEDSLSGEALHLAVAHTLDLKTSRGRDGKLYALVRATPHQQESKIVFEPSTDWVAAGYVIEHARPLVITPNREGGYIAWPCGENATTRRTEGHGATMLLAVMRAVVAADRRWQARNMEAA